MAIVRSGRRVASGRLRALAGQLLDASTLCAISTVSPGGRAHVNTAYFAWSPSLDLVWLSDPHATHSSNVRTRRTAAVAVYDSHQAWGNPDRGIQLVGVAQELMGRAAGDAESVYVRRFPEHRESGSAGYRFYRFRPRRLKVFDERALGTAVFVTARVSRGEVSWERTEIYPTGT
jgi:uncharacterized protein YhbP (UPF0306 family)